MRFLADENCDMAVVRALRNSGHDVALVKDLCRGADDEAVAVLAQTERRILLTEDKGFGQIAQALTANGVGIVLLRFPTNARSQIGSDVERAVSGFAAQLENAFVVIEPGQVRITKPQT